MRKSCFVCIYIKALMEHWQEQANEMYYNKDVPLIDLDL